MLVSPGGPGTVDDEMNFSKNDINGINAQKLQTGAKPA